LQVAGRLSELVQIKQTALEKAISLQCFCFSDFGLYLGHASDDVGFSDLMWLFRAVFTSL